MANNRSFWHSLMSKSDDKKVVTSTKDPMEEGLESLSWFEGQRLAVKKRIIKTRETFGEEIGNSITHGVMALFLLGMLPYTAVRAYIHAPEGFKVLDTVGISIFVICMFLMFLASTIYHSMKHDTPQKRVMNKIDHIMIYFAIAGTYFPICISVIGGGLGLGILIAEWALAIAGTIIKSLMFSKTKLSYAITCILFLAMGWLIVFSFGKFYATSPVAFWLVRAGGICYTLSLIFFSSKYKFAHMIFHFCVDFGAICHFIGLVYFLR